MTEDSKRLDIVRIERGNAKKVQDIVSREKAVMVFLNEVEITTLMCSPSHLEYLAVGFLVTEGIVRGREDIAAVTVQEEDDFVRVETAEDSDDSVPLKRMPTTGGERIVATHKTAQALGSLRSESTIRISSASVHRLMDDFLGRSKTFEQTGTVHSAALCSAERVLAFHEDIGRHNALDKVIGESVLKGLLSEDSVLMTSGRITAEVLLKAATCKIPIVLSKSAPTDLAVGLAMASGTTLVGFVRGQRMNVYTGEGRILPEGNDARAQH